MLEDIIRLFRIDRKGVSNAIVVMLSLVLVAIVVSNVVLWSYQMNQVDWEKMQEKLAFTEAERVSVSPWFTSQEEYALASGRRLNGSYLDTKTIDNLSETFVEEANSCRLIVIGDFRLNLMAYKSPYVKSIELQMRYRANDSLENLFLSAYDWRNGAYSDSGFNSTSGSFPTPNFSYYNVSLGTSWSNYVAQNGTLRVMLSDDDNDQYLTLIDLDFLGARLVVEGMRLMFENNGPVTSHVVALWILNASLHERYELDVYINAGTTAELFRGDIRANTESNSFKAITERGNVAIFTE